MKRRDFVQKSAAIGAVAASFTSGSLMAGSLANNKPETAPVARSFNLKYAPHFGMFKNSAGDDLIDQLKFMHEQGFTALEDNGMMKRDVSTQEKIGKEMEKLGMDMGVFVVDKGGNGANTLAADKKEHLDIFLDGCKRAVEVAKRVNAKWMTVVPGDFERRLPLDMQTANVVEALKRGAEIFEPHGLVMVLEPLSDSPNLFLRHSYQAYMICKAVDSPSCKILHDFYHLQRNEGDLVRNMDAAWNEIAYIQVGDNPGRKEPTTGEINYKNVFRHLHGKGFTGIVGMEHGNFRKGKEGEEALIKAYHEVDSFNMQ